jgi:hypothetical protein
MTAGPVFVLAVPSKNAKYLEISEKLLLISVKSTTFAGRNFNQTQK